jgi:hypothetical protein
MVILVYFFKYIFQNYRISNECYLSRIRDFIFLKIKEKQQIFFINNYFSESNEETLLFLFSKSIDASIILYIL